MEREARIQAAEDFLKEAVFRSREVQSSIDPWGGPAQRQASGPGNCGLGQEAAIELELTPRAEEILPQLELADLAHVRSIQSEWIERQDALDRKRNHFLRDFRRRHGADRTAYDASTLADFEAGLEDVNLEESRDRRAAALRLLSIAAE